VLKHFWPVFYVQTLAAARFRPVAPDHPVKTAQSPIQRIKQIDVRVFFWHCMIMAYSSDVTLTDSQAAAFFLSPEEPLHRQYEALRAYFVQ
jgi:hypothetical protein